MPRLPYLGFLGRQPRARRLLGDRSGGREPEEESRGAKGAKQAGTFHLRPPIVCGQFNCFPRVPWVEVSLVRNFFKYTAMLMGMSSTTSEVPSLPRCHPLRAPLYNSIRGCPPRALPPSQTQAVLGRRRFGPLFTSYWDMSRRIRFIPEEGALVEVTCRTLHSRLLLRPSPRLNQIIIGTLARVKHRHGVRRCFFVCASNHLPLLLGVDDAKQRSSFMGAFSSKLAREVGRLTGWRQKIFSRRYQAIVVSEEEAAQIERLRYGLAHGCKEDLVERPRDWPGVHAVRALLEGEILEGLWFDRTQEYAARRRGETFDPLQYATREILELDPLPCWKHLTEEQRRERTASLVADIEAEAAVRRKSAGIRPRGPAAVLAQNPLRRPLKTKKSPAPAFHAASQAVRRELRDAYGWFVGAVPQPAEEPRAGGPPA